ncbi:MAG: hypothetical protein NTV51_11300 [Verrucomicrobia bacterium]|nr:hypothetical protein [Verrucomicrobiota bacterium]
MAFQKTLALPTGVSGDYFRITSFRWDRNGAREASAAFALFKDAATAVAGQPLVPIVAKLRLSGTGFDDYLSPSALAAAEGDVIAQLYLAAKDACDAYAADGEVNLEAQVICDYGAGVFADAESV